MVRLLVPLGLLLGLVGYFGPWVAHKAAALVLTGQDLGEFVKFLPDVRSGAITVQRELFYLPLFAGAVGLLAAASDRRLRFPWPLRWLFVALAVPASLSMLPPAWTPQLMLTSEFHLQAATIGLCLLLILLHPLLSRLRPALLEASALLLALAAAIVPGWQFARARPLIDAVYGRPVDLGWGLWVAPLGFFLLALAYSLALGAGEASPDYGQE